MDSGIPVSKEINSEWTLNDSVRSDDSYVGKEESGYDGSSEASVDSLDDDTTLSTVESDMAWLHVKQPRSALAVTILRPRTARMRVTG